MNTKAIILIALPVLAAAGVAGFFATRATAGPVELTMQCPVNAKFKALCLELTQEFTRTTGIRVNTFEGFDNASVALSVIQEIAQTKTPVDLVDIDVIWPGILKDNLLDLKPYFSDTELADFFPRIIANNTIDGKLLGIPTSSDAGVLYYRTDLLAKYGFSNPPHTWDELEKIARTIQAGERASNPNFYGFVWQGAQYESNTCNALEWLESFGAGHVVESNGTISINNDKAIAALETMRGFVGSIAPKNVTGLREETSRAIWQAGNAAFMRNWPYAYGLGNADDSPIKGKFDAGLLPTGPGGKNAATLGGWQMGVMRHTRHPKEATELLRFMTSAKVQKTQALAGYNSARQSLYRDPDVLASNPFLNRLPAILDKAVSRPSGVTGAKYDEVSTAFTAMVQRVTSGKVSANVAMKELQGNLEAIRANGW